MALSAATSSITRLCSVCGTTYLHGSAHQCALGNSRPADGADLLGAVLGERYRIVSCLSKGGMGVVYRAQHTVLDKPLAIKIMLQPQDESARQRFLQEAKLASLVHHPNIVDIVDFGVLSSQQPYLVMELLSGQTLADAIFQGPLSAARTCYVAAQVARGLYAVHQKGIIHRDLKPANIFVLKPDVMPGTPMQQAPSEVVKIVDFGIATVVNPEENGTSGPQARLTTPGMVLGTAEYMSPEQAQGLKTDHRVDQYALGCIMYEMVTGKVPFQGTTPAATMLKHLTEKPVPPSKLRPEIPPELERLILRAMSNDPAMRFPSMLEVEQGLVTVFEKTRRRSLQSSTLQLPKAPPEKQSRLQVLLGAGLGVVLMGLIAIIITLRKPTTVPNKPDTTKTALVKTAQPTTVNWYIKSEPVGATVVRVSDGKVLGRTPMRRDMPLGEGSTVIELRLDGYQPVEMMLKNSEDESPKRAHLTPTMPGKDKGSKKDKNGVKVKPKKRASGIRDNDDIEAIK